MLGRDNMSHYNEYALFSIVSTYINIYITSIANVSSELYATFLYMPLLILIYSMMWQLICKYEPF